MTMPIRLPYWESARNNYDGEYENTTKATCNNIIEYRNINGMVLYGRSLFTNGRIKSLRTQRRRHRVPSMAQFARGVFMGPTEGRPKGSIELWETNNMYTCTIITGERGGNMPSPNTNITNGSPPPATEGNEIHSFKATPHSCRTQATRPATMRCGSASYGG